MPAGRFAPSPTGPLHLGNLRTALLAWLFARADGASVGLRMDDLDDTARPEHDEAQRRDLAALGLDWDGRVVRQSERLDRYVAAIAALDRAGLTYPCYCTRREIRDAVRAPHREAPEGAYPGTCRDLGAAARREREESERRPALRLRTDGQRVGFVDRQLGPCEGRVDDLVLRRGDGTPAYNLTVVVDDADAGVREVVRADDLVPSTPRQIHLARLLGADPPAHAHVPLVLGPDGNRLAKRHGSVTLADRSALGEDALAVRSRLAWSLGLCAIGDRPTLDDLLSRFDPVALPRRTWTLADGDIAGPVS